MTTAVAITASILVVVQTIVIWREISDRVAWRHTLDAITNTQEQVVTLRKLQTALVDNVSDKVQLLTTGCIELQTTLADCRAVRDSMTALISSNGYEWVREYGPRFMDDVIRNVTNQLTVQLQQGLVHRTTQLAGEYVLLQTLDTLDLEVRLQARSYRPEVIRAALIKLLEWHPRKPKTVTDERSLAEQFKQQTRDAQELAWLLGSLGEELMCLEWNGAVAVAKKRLDGPSTDELSISEKVSVPAVERRRKA